MARVYNGSATIDDQMFLRKADDDFYKFVGQDMYAPITQSVHPDDLNRLVTALDELKNNDMSQNIISARIKRHNGKYRWVMMELSYEPFDLDGRVLINLKLVDIAESENNNTELKRLNNEYDTYLGLLNSIMLSYDMDTEYIDIYMVGSGQHMHFFEGTMAEWKESMSGDKLDVTYAEAFNALCNDMEEGKKNISYDIRTNAFSHNGGMELCTFRCQTIRSVARSRKVLGCILTYGKNNEKDIVLGMEYNKDAGLDVLNKKAITDYARRMMMPATDRKIYLIVIDLDDFKVINDTLGHMFGDEVLVTVSEILKDAVGERGIVGRIGGDELLIVLDKVDEHAELRNMLRTIRTNVEWAYKGKRDDVHLSCSMGIAAYPDHADGYEKVFQLADKMLYRAKAKGKNRYVIYTPEIHDAEYKDTVEKHSEDVIAKLQANKTGILYNLIENFLVRKVVTYETMLNEVGFAFGLDEIIMVYEDLTITTTWTQESVLSEQEDIHYIRNMLKEESDFMSEFDDNNVFYISGLFSIEGKYPKMHKYLKGKGIEAAMFYKIIKQGRVSGFVIFARKNRRQQWSEFEKIILSLIGKVMDISVSDR